MSQVHAPHTPEVHPRGIRRPSSSATASTILPGGAMVSSSRPPGVLMKRTFTREAAPAPTAAVSTFPPGRFVAGERSSPAVGSCWHQQRNAPTVTRPCLSKVDRPVRRERSQRSPACGNQTCRVGRADPQTKAGSLVHSGVPSVLSVRSKLSPDI
jgi:hypothetical protein